ncbi:MAG: CoA ester lyase [Rugosibacter sp.]|nr:CoA ester lyase [Rugosibacter sp.]MDD3380852.1 CoA ester lyase [Rugosibacter sp.]HPB90023.1 CoA ester lyase [Rugosibacter sp.]HQN46962.1 CoA ester lyase [Rugosibacter sp.]
MTNSKQCIDLRSYLFVPGNRPERFAKALDSGADAIIIDLEDAVAAEEKAASRRHIEAALDQGLFRSNVPSIYVRINAADTEWFIDDLALIKEAHMLGVMLPKAEHAEQVARIHEMTEKLCRVIPIIETATGLINAQAIAQADGVERLAFGSIDFQLDLQCDGSETALLYARSQLVAVSRWAELAAPVDGVTVALDDAEQLTQDAQHAKSLGMGAKLCIHPRQVSIVNAIWQPTRDEITWAKKVISALAQVESGGQSGQNAMKVDGMMIDRPVLLKAQRILNQLRME